MTSGVIQIRQYDSRKQPIITIQTWRYDGIHDISNEIIGRLATVKDENILGKKGSDSKMTRRDISRKWIHVATSRPGT